ncbi:MAG: hypothetical protein JWM95_3667 [Gemmatimonadetes bacterium]|nr:hypothetical protein [Gemmatimonadota bacterium]
MRKLYWLARRLFARTQDQADLRQEIEASYDMVVAEHRARGASADDANRAARRELGSAAALREDVQDAWTGAWLEQFARDVRYALRGLRRDPGFAISCVLTFGLAIGGTTVVGTLASTLLLRPLPFPDSDRLVMVMQRGIHETGEGHNVSAPNARDWSARNRSFERMAYFEFQTFNISAGNAPLQTGGLRASHELFEVLRAKPLLGRTPVAADDDGTSGDVVVLSYSLWHDSFAADSTLIGRAIQVNKKPYTVIGVMRPELVFPGASQKLWIPMLLSENDKSRRSQSFFGVARLRNGVSLEQAQRDLRRVGSELAREYPQSNEDESINAFPLREVRMQNITRVIRLLSAAVALVSVMAVVNVAGLLLARGGARSREFGARLALGGSRARLITQLITESTVVALLGGVLGIAIAYVALPLFIAIPGLGLRSLPFRTTANVTIDVRILVASLAVALASGIIAGLVPAFSVVPRSPAALLRQGGARGATARARHGIRNSLLAIEVGLAVVVLVGAGLLTDSVRRATSVDPGFDARNVFLFSLALPQKDFYGVPERPLFCGQLEERVGSSGGVISASAVSSVPLSGNGAGRSFSIEGRPAPLPKDMPGASYGIACPNFFRTMNIPLLGRDFSPRDVVAASQVAIVNGAFQRKYFAGERAVGKRIRLGGDSAPWIEIIGVTADVRHSALTSDVEPYLYLPYSQAVWPYMNVVVRTSNGSHATLRQIQERVKAIAPDEPVGEPITMQSVADSSLGYMKFPLYMMLAFAAIAVLLTIVGVFGVASQVVVQRTRELGIRRALGATRGNLYQLVVAQTLAPAVLGMIGGVVVARISGGVLNGLLYGVTATDVRTFLLMTVLLGAFTVIACMAPAHRAASVDPSRTLRND